MWIVRLSGIFFKVHSIGFHIYTRLTSHRNNGACPLVNHIVVASVFVACLLNFGYIGRSSDISRLFEFLII
ncbi:hypothetical protein TNIN_364341 [Trichonephila inaurata madagascariensis]|uniref:Uncharacterized protein n=1 Tax=Trichonephila inaurata madagascariensis TaxID=2747483 RepID=A0A8X6YBK5_9ARAC|nr:hypothetical protein TNIN_364341 [Trichonephila inaurata madagascariensis]